ncbi:MAG: hypothetical protein ABIA04_15545 [Pseudomonadota bacterium]
MHKKLSKLLILIILISISACSNEIIETRNSDEVCEEYEAPDTKDADTDDQRDDEQDQNSEEKNFKLFIAIHLEPGTGYKDGNYQERYWPILPELIASADYYNVKLNLMFNPQWGAYILEDNDKLTLVRQWEASGHELGFHHHGPNHNGSWNGYTNQEEYKLSKNYLGSIDEAMTILNQLPSCGKIISSTVGPEEDVQYDLPTEIMYNTEGGSEKYDDLSSNPEEREINSQMVWIFKHARLAALSSDINWDLSEMESLIYDGLDTNTTYGIVFHEHEYDSDPEVFNSFFQILNENNIFPQTLPELMK